MQLREIRDLGLVAALTTLGYAPIEHRVEGRKVIFTFDVDEQVEEIISNYYNNRLEVDAHTYFSAVRSTKAILYALVGENK